jgi:hypothetical protein
MYSRYLYRMCESRCTTINIQVSIHCMKKKSELRMYCVIVFVILLPY